MSEFSYVVDQQFWGDRLEVNTELVLKQFEDEGFMAKWAKGLSPRCRSYLLDYFDIEEDGLRIAEAREAILDEHDELIPFLLVDEATKGRRTYAMVEVARAKLSIEELDACRINAEVDRFDRTAIMWRLFALDEANLELVHHLDRTLRKGFARLILARNPLNEPVVESDEFFTVENIQAILDEFEAESTTHRQSYCADIMKDDGGNFQVFVKRDNKSSFVAHGPKNIFGFEPEWIVYEYSPDLRRVQICSDTPNIPLTLATLIAGRFFGEAVEYENESIVTDGEKVEDFLRSLINEPDKLPLVEIVTKNCGIEGSPQLRLNNQEDESLAPSISHFGEAFGNPLDDIDDIASIKVYKFKKRVKMILEPDKHKSEKYIVRYADQPLNGKQRREFEEMMKDEYGIVVLSTEKKRRES